MEVHSSLHIGQGLSTLALLMFWAELFFIERVVLYIEGCLAVSLVSSRPETCQAKWYSSGNSLQQFVLLYIHFQAVRAGLWTLLLNAKL